MSSGEIISTFFPLEYSSSFEVGAWVSYTILYKFELSFISISKYSFSFSFDTAFPVIPSKRLEKNPSLSEIVTILEFAFI